MSNLLCHTGTWGSIGNMGIGGWVGLILNLVLWIGLLAGLTLLAVRARRLARVPATTVQATATDILQAQYARGEITLEEYELKKQDIGKTMD